MNNDLISRSALIAAIDNAFQSFAEHDDILMLYSDVRFAAISAPDVDAVEVVHGEWVYHECVSSCDGAISGYSCSKCRAFVDEEVFDMDEFHKDFCGNCGAKMDGERKGDDA